jgi:hypothetical protein
VARNRPKQQDSSAAARSTAAACHVQQQLRCMLQQQLESCLPGWIHEQ